MKITEYGRSRVASEEFRERIADVYKVQREQHRASHSDVFDGLRVLTALELVMPAKRELPSLEELRTLEEFIAANLEAIDAAISKVIGPREA